MNNPTEKSLEAECREAFEKWSESVKDFGHTVQPNSATARQRKLGWDAAWNTRKGEAARLKAMVDKPEVVSRLAIAICPWYGNVEADISPAFVWKELSEVKRDAYRRQAKAVLTELVKMVRE